MAEFINETDLIQIIGKYGLDIRSFVNLQIGYDGKVYMLFNEQIPERINGMFVPSESNREFSVLVLEVDWYEEKIIKENHYNLGMQIMNYLYVQPIDGDLLLSTARCHYNGGKPEQNAVIMDVKGDIISEFCLGDGIAECIVRPDGNIVVSYFDEGIFGNYGWTAPLGACGIRVVDRTGKSLWEAEKDIFECYATNLDEEGNIWYYYYDSFKIVSTDTKKEIEYNPNISGASIVIPTADKRGVIMDMGYNKHGQFAALHFNGDGLREPKPVSLQYGGMEIETGFYRALGSRAVFLSKNLKLYFRKFDSIEI